MGPEHVPLPYPGDAGRGRTDEIKVSLGGLRGRGGAGEREGAGKEKGGGTPDGRTKQGARVPRLMHMDCGHCT